jgi:hypothetical protein
LVREQVEHAVVQHLLGMMVVVQHVVVEVVVRGSECE